MIQNYNGFLYQTGTGKSKVIEDNFPKEINVKGIESFDISKIDINKLNLIKQNLIKKT